MSEKDVEMVILKSNILRTGEKFLVTDKSTDGKFTPGSTGFVSFVKGIDQQFVNVVHLTVVMTKKGKGGKERIESGDLSTPIFDVGLDDDESTLPGPDRKFFTRIEHIVNNVSNVDQMDIYDFMGWALARAKFLYKLSSKTQHVKVWPQSNSLLSTTMELQNHFSENSSKTKEYYSRSDIIDEILTVLAKTEAKLSKCYIDYMYKTTELERNAITNLYDFYCGRQTPKEVLTVLNNTALYYSAKMDRLFKLSRINAGAVSLTNKVKAEVITILDATSSLY